MNTPLKWDTDGEIEDSSNKSPGLLAVQAFSKKGIIFHLFVWVSMLLAIMEPFLVVWADKTWLIQLSVLGASSGMFLIELIILMTFMPQGLRFHQKFLAALLPEIWIEISSLFIGWSTFFVAPSFSCLRCFRMLRFAWFSKVVQTKKTDYFYCIVHFSRLVALHLEKLGKELFGSESKGGIAAIGLYFYIIYIFAVAFWQISSPIFTDRNGMLAECDTLKGCFFVMMRLSVFDGTGFDYMSAVMEETNIGISILLFLFVIMASMVMLNVVVGIFSKVFQLPIENMEIPVVQAVGTGGKDIDNSNIKSAEIQALKIQAIIKEQKELTKNVYQIERVMAKLVEDMQTVKQNLNPYNTNKT